MYKRVRLNRLIKKAIHVNNLPDIFRTYLKSTLSTLLRIQQYPNVLG